MGLILTDKTREYYESKKGIGRSIEFLFSESKEKQPNGTTYLWFAEATNRKGFSRRRLREAFNKLVSKDDYGDGEKKDTFEFLYDLNLKK